MKIFFISILNWISFLHLPVIDAQTKFEPFLLRYDRYSLTHQLPTETIPSVYDENIDTLCPSETEDDKRNSDIISRDYPFAKYCLYIIKKTFDQNKPKHCTEQVKPWLKYDEDKSCGTSPNHKIYGFGFYHCGSAAGQLRELRKEKTEQELIDKFRDYVNMKESGKRSLPLFYPIYEMCIDTSNGKAVWTKHTIMTPAMFTDYEEKLQHETGGDTEISTDPYQFPANTFTDQKQKYDTQDAKSDKMVKNFLVPKEHVAVRVWRTTVNHFINIAPLWENLEKLMTAINQGIRKIALKLHSDGVQYDIYNGVVDLFTDDGKLIKMNNQFPKNIWYKLLYLYQIGKAVLIVLHNTPHSPPKKKICETETPCNLNMWYEKKNDNDEDISDELFEYAYCCNTSKPEVEKLFKLQLPFEIESHLILDDFFKRSSEGPENISDEQKTAPNNNEQLTK